MPELRWNDIDAILYQLSGDQLRINESRSVL